MDGASNTARMILAAGALCGLLAVAAGAFGAHGLRDSLDAYRLGIFDTAARYQMYHALALLGVGALAVQAKLPSRRLGTAALLFGAGIVLFCGSLYGLAFGAPKWTGAITPVGGLLFMAGWLTLAIAALGKPDRLQE
jgi:uncharacterized membrane protein YgdD (TMEM256/DUF423 family)